MTIDSPGFKMDGNLLDVDPEKLSKFQRIERIKKMERMEKELAELKK